MVYLEQPPSISSGSSLNSAPLRERRAMAPGRSKSSDCVLLHAPFEPLRRPPPRRTNSAAEKSKRVMAISNETISVTSLATLASVGVNVPICHDLFEAEKYDQALEYYTNILQSINDNHTTKVQCQASDVKAVKEYVSVACHAAKCCYYLHQYGDEESFYQRALHRMSQVTDDNDSFSLGELQIQCTLQMAKSIGRQRKTVESVQALRECRGLIQKYTVYKTVKDYMSKMEPMDQVGFVGGATQRSNSLVISGLS
ncbi:hypothetical protein MPSEU_000755500 [Mayamaea pseudoterrestris]|nr:hypothetical protein MPSEU_000755500 [Mayamaea pseudoterrestris]